MLNKEKLDNLAGELWKAAIKLRGKFKPKDYPTVVLPMIVIRRIECVLEEKRKEIAEEIVTKKIKSHNPKISEATLCEELQKRFENYFRGEIDLQGLKISFDELKKQVKQREVFTISFHNKGDWTIKKILDGNRKLVENHFRDYLKNFAPIVQLIIEKFEYRATIGQMVKANRLDSIMTLVAEQDFSPKRLSNLEIGYVYEELLQRFSQDDAKDTGEHFTPREIIRIMVELMEIDFDPKTSKKAISIYDPACGTGGMLSVAKEHLIDKTTTDEEKRKVEDLVMVFGQEYLAQNYAVCLSDMLLKGEKLTIDDANKRQPVLQITHGNSLIKEDATAKEEGDFHQQSQFDYMISNPPFGVEWDEYATDVLKLKKTRYRWGLPPSNDGAFLFLQSMIDKMKSPDDGGSKIAILFNGSPLSNGDALSGESEIRRNILEEDLLDTIVMLPDQMFYNTGIFTYVWILSNNKPKKKKNRVLIINAREQYEKEPKSFGNKRNRITPDHRTWIKDKYDAWQPDDHCKIFSTKHFAFHKAEVIFWQEDEKGEKMFITEKFTVQLNNANVNKRYDLYGDLDFKIMIASPFIDDKRDVVVKLNFNDSKAFETLLAETLQQEKELKDKNVKEIKSWMKTKTLKAEYTHRHYIVDSEYIPYDKTRYDKYEYINEFLHREIDYEIIRWTECEQLGYEILPNKYFYRYVEPTASEKLLNQFWKLEDNAEVLLNEIKAI